MSTTPSIRAELAAAIRSLSAQYHSLPENRRPDVTWAAPDDALEEALAADDRGAALAAIAEWKAHHLRQIEAVAP